jgi:hypothetical protein
MPLSCDVCGNTSRVRRIERDELRSGAALWIKDLCPACQRRLGRRDTTPRESDT